MDCIWDTLNNFLSIPQSLHLQFPTFFLTDTNGELKAWEMNAQPPSALCYSPVSAASKRFIRWGKRREPISIRWSPGRALSLSAPLFLSFNLSTFNKVFAHLTCWAWSTSKAPRNTLICSLPSCYPSIHPSVHPSKKQLSFSLHPHRSICPSLLITLPVFHSFLCHICDHPSIFFNKHNRNCSM